MQKNPTTPSEETLRRRNRFNWGFGEARLRRGGDGSRPPLGKRRAREKNHRHLKLKHQRLGLLDLRQGLHLGEHVSGHRAVDLDQRDGVAALLDTAEMERRDVELGIAEQARKVADEARLV